MLLIQNEGTGAEHVSKIGENDFTLNPYSRSAERNLGKYELLKPLGERFLSNRFHVK